MAAEDSRERASGASVVGARKLATSASWLFCADIVFTAGRALTLFILGRLLGSEGFGSYLAILGLTQLLFPVFRAGIAHVMVRSLSRGVAMDAVWPKVLGVHVLGGILGSLTSVGISSLLFDASVVTTVLIGLGQLIGLGILQAGNMAAAAYAKSVVSLVNNGVSTVLRVSALALFALLVDEPTVDAWAWFLAGSMLPTALATALLMRRSLGARLRLALPRRDDLSLGAGFVFVDFANSAQTDIDKVVLGACDLNAGLGVYGVASRVAEVALLPLNALVRASYSEFFRRGTGAIGESIQYARRLTTLATSYGLVIGAGLWIAAPILEPLMGEEFQESVSALRWIALLPALKALQVFPANVLSGTDRQWTRARLVITTATLNLVLNIIFAPRFGWRGAAAATLAAESGFAALLWLRVGWDLRNERRSENS